jgi:surface protein
LDNIFEGCEDLEDLLGLQDLVKYPNNYEIPIYLTNMFKDCKKLSNIDPISEWNTNMVYTFESMFSGCSELRDISATFGWDMSNARSIAGMFFNTSLDIINPVNDWDLQNCSIVRAAFSRSPYVYGASEYIYNPPTIDDAYGINWTEVVDRYNNGDLTLDNFFGTDYNFYRRYGKYIIKEEQLMCTIPGYTDKYIAYNPNGVFGSFDVNYKEAHISSLSGYLIIHFIYSNKLPDWYKQMYVDSYRIYYDTLQPGNTISISYV